MATRQYVGARYVPIIDGEWDNSKTYEPLVIVTHEGNSYTSRTFIPAGIDISNETYWVLTGNYNAQVEAYRQEVANLSDDIDDLKFYATPQMYGAVGNGVADDTQAFIDCLSDGNKLIYIPAGEYKITDTITVPDAGTRFIGVSDSMRDDNTTIHFIGSGNLFNFTDANGCSIENIMIIGSGAANFNNTDGVAVNLPADSYNFYMKNVTIQKIGVGVKASSAWAIKLDNVKIYYTNNAIELNTITDISLINCILYLSNVGIKAATASILAFNLYSDNCKVGVQLNSGSSINIYGYKTEGGADSGSTLNTVAIEKIDSDSYATIYDFTFYDNSGTHIIAKVPENSNLLKAIHFINPRLSSGNSFQFDIDANAQYGCIIIDANNISNYSSSIPDKVLVNGRYFEKRLHGEYINNQERYYTGLTNSNLSVISGDSYGTITLYCDQGIESVNFRNIIDGSLIKDNNSLTLLLVTRNSNGTLAVEKASNVTSPIFKIECYTNGYINNSDNTFH